MLRRIIYVYLIFVFLFSVFIYFFVSYRKNSLYTAQSLDYIISTTSSRWRIKYSSPCDTFISGDPSIGDNWVKINFHCPQGIKNSTLATTVFQEKSWKNIITEFSRIIGFSPLEVFDEKQWTCYLDRKVIISNKSEINWNNLARQKGVIDCIDSLYNISHINQNYEK